MRYVSPSCARCGHNLELMDDWTHSYICSPPKSPPVDTQAQRSFTATSHNASLHALQIIMALVRRAGGKVEIGLDELGAIEPGVSLASYTDRGRGVHILDIVGDKK